MAAPTIIGILNVTPDSYFDGGKFTSVDAALKQVEQMVCDGVDIIEIGGESTGPKAPDVSLEEELRRTIPVLEVLRKHFPSATFAIDTYKSAVAKEALDQGVTMINDVTAGRGDGEMFSLIASHSSKPKYVMMFSKDPTARTSIAETKYDDVIATVKGFLKDRKEEAMKAGIKEEQIVLDPGLGHFVSSLPEYSFEIIARLKEFSELGSPLYVSPSRKSFLAGKENLKTVDRLPGTLAASVIAMLNGASYIRTHDVLETKRALEAAKSIQDALKS
jgi:dihydropteroate synthase